MIGDLIGEWIKGILIDGIMGNLSGLFNTVNTKVGEIASDVGSTPQDWNGGIFSMLQNLSETVIVPIAAAILALVMCYELIDMIVEKNNMHDFDSSMFFRWIFKSAFAILIVTNTWNIVMGVFDATQQVVNQSAGVIIGDTSIDFDTLLPDLESRLEAMDIGPLLGLWFQTLVVGLTMNILSICIKNPCGTTRSWRRRQRTPFPVSGRNSTSNGNMPRQQGRRARPHRGRQAPPRPRLPQPRKPQRKADRPRPLPPGTGKGR